MARKNLLDPTLGRETATVMSPALRPAGAPSIASLRDSMRDMAASSVQDLDPSVIETGGLRDRLTLDPESIGKLAESIREHGQQVPILVRPIPGKMNRYAIVYGRRRLAAIRSLGAGYRVKAIIRSLEDEAAIIAQGQENNLRVDPSFIEKALFVQALRQGEFSTRIIQDALGIDPSAISRMLLVVDNIPTEVVEAIGPAPDVGRRPWTDLAMLARDHSVDLVQIVSAEGDSWASQNSNARFARILELAQESSDNAALRQANEIKGINDAALQNDVASDHLARGQGGQAGRRVEVEGLHFGSMKKSRRILSINVSLRHQPDFGQWLEDNADEAVRLLHERWKESREKG